MQNPYLIRHPDPYDIWMSEPRIKLRRRFYSGQLLAKVEAALVMLADWLAPSLMRKRLSERTYPISVAQNILCENPIKNPRLAVEAIKTVASGDARYGTSWGLGFPWMSKNGFYDDQIPFITHTPYVIEALLKLEAYPEVAVEVRETIANGANILNLLKLQHESADQLALSYAPMDEPRIVINANAYACFLSALFYRRDKNPLHLDRATRLARFVVSQQNQSGAWNYYADDDSGNFIDCFHSCFVIKNLKKAAEICDTLADIVGPAIIKGKEFIDLSFVDSNTGLVKRFVQRDFLDPYVWDLYDQAEYLGLLIDFNELDRASTFRDIVATRFLSNGHWFCKLDWFGRRWGKDFKRWGILPFQHQSSRLDERLQS